VTVCRAASIVVDDESLAYFGPGGAHWRAPLKQIRLLGELRSPSLDDSHVLAVAIDDTGSWLQAPCCATGIDEALEKLGRAWGFPMRLQLTTHEAELSRVLWPPPLAGEQMFERDVDGRLAVRSQIIDALAR
jgi:hypothetical protein